MLRKTPELAYRLLYGKAYDARSDAMDTLNVPVTAVLTVMIGCTVLALTLVDGDIFGARRSTIRVIDAATAGERIVSRALADETEPNAGRLLQETRASYGDKATALLIDGVDRYLARIHETTKRNRAYRLRSGLEATMGGGEGTAPSEPAAAGEAKSPREWLAEVATAPVRSN
jgi:hypothetical protein